MTLFFENPAGPALVAASLVSGAHAQDHHQVRLPEPEDRMPQGPGRAKFADLVAAKTGGKIQGQLFPGGTLGGGCGVGLAGGTVEMTVLARASCRRRQGIRHHDFPSCLPRRKKPMP